VTEELGLTLAFATGLLGALHCLGMCSGIAGGFFVHRSRGDRLVSLAPVLAYHGSRILVYTLLGAAGAAAGRVLVQTGLIGKGQGVLMMVAGVLIVLLGLGLLRVPTQRWGKGAESSGASIQVRLSPSGGLGWRPIVAGVLNGFVPCGLVFSVALKAAATADPLRAALLMVAFGLGTLPAMALVSLTGAVIGARARGLLGRLAGLAVVALGLWTFYEGLVFFDIMRGLGNW
jgi:sulfite exporter TauE/SafE